ncbi:MAG: T9SS type A sorting domain-containing protein [Cytophagaceae bacterium]|nr:T9SS type A sorting domain-containing protein [Cytophagaceae bacterium]
MFSQDLLRALKIYYNNACEGGTTSFSYIFGGSAISQSWDFGDPGSGVLNTSTAASPTHVYATAGTYTVNLSVVDNCGRTRTESVNVIVKTGPTVTIPATTCANTNITLTGTGVNAANYTWSNNSNGLPVIQTGSTYVYNGALPKTIYVQDPTPLATYTAGHTSMPDCFAPSVGNVYFEVFTNITLASFQLQCRAAPGAANVSIQNDLGTITYWGPVAAPVAANALLTMNPNVILAPGKYRFFTSNASGSFCRNQFINPDGGRDVAGVIDVTGENNGLRGGSFFNIGVSLPDPCGIRAYTITDNCPLPVTLIEFSGFKSGNVSQLHWVTSSERDSDHFILQRSPDGINYSNLRVVKASGNSDMEQNYGVIDDMPLQGKNYYRLAQYDVDGKMNMIDKVVLIDMESAIINIAPNPFNHETKIAFSENAKANIKVLDMLGRTVSEFTKEKDQLVLTIGSYMSAGSYVLHIVTETGASNFIIVKE